MGDDAFRLPFRSHNLGFTEVERAPNRGRRSLADEDLAWLRSLFESCCDVHGIAGYERASFAGPADDDVASVDTDPQRERIGEHLLETALHGESGVKCAFSVVLVRSGGP